MTITAKPFEGLKPGMYPATLDGYEEDSGEFGPSIKLIWALDGMTNADGEQVTKWQWVSQKLTPRSNLWNILKTLGTTPVFNQDYEVDELLAPQVGAHVQLMIKQVDGAQGPQDKIVDMVAANGAAPTSAKAPPSAKKAGGKATPAAATGLGPCVVCDEPGTAYTGKGKVVCDACNPDAKGPRLDPDDLPFE